MKIEAVDLFYLSMPEVLDVADGSQDALLVRIAAGGFVGWGECETSPLPGIASWCCPMSHAICKPVRDSVLGQILDGPEDIARISRLVRQNGLDMPTTDHVLSGIDIALWDLMGKKLGQPIYELIGYQCAYPKTPYASQLFGDTPQETFEKAQRSRQQGYRAVKFGWGPYGHGTVKDDRDQIAAGREGLGEDAELLIDAGTAWADDVERARPRLDALLQYRALWLEEPFVSGALEAYKDLSKISGDVKLAGGEGAHNYFMAKHMIDHAGIGFVQIDTGRIGGISPAKAVADYAHDRGVTYVNHTFTSHLALSASLQPFAGLEADHICEYPVELTRLGSELTVNHLALNDDGQVQLPAAPGLGIDPEPGAIKKYLVEVEVIVSGQTLYRTPDVDP